MNIPMASAIFRDTYNMYPFMMSPLVMSLLIRFWRVWNLEKHLKVSVEDLIDSNQFGDLNNKDIHELVTSSYALAN